MDWYVVAILILIVLIALIGSGLPVPFAMFAAALPFLWTIQDFPTSIVSTEMTIWRAWVHYILLSVPLFIFLGEVVGRSTIGPQLYEAMHRGVPARGAAAFGTVGACAGFGAVCGASLIGALTIGRVALPEMLRLGYGKRLATGVIAAGGTLSVMIPPSLVLIYYGIIAEVSIGKLFIAGIVPGLILSLGFVVVVLVWRFVAPADVPTVPRSGRWSFVNFCLAILPIAAIATIIIGALYLGIATPTEAAGVGAIVTTILGFTIGKLTVRDFVDALLSTVRTMGYLGLLLVGALLLGFVLNYHLVPQKLAALFSHLQLSPLGALAIVLIFYFILGMFLDPASLTFITLPTMLPLIKVAGYDLVWFGIVYTVLMEMAAITPPVGMNLYVLQNLAPKVRIEDVILGCLPFLLTMFAVIGLLIVFPGLVASFSVK